MGPAVRATRGLPEMPRGVRFLPKPYQFSGLMAALNEEVSLH